MQKWFTLDPVENFTNRHNFKWWFLVVISPNGVGKTFWMINKFLEREKAGLITGFIVRNKSSDYERILKLLEEYGIYYYRQRSYELFRIKKKIVKTTNKQKPQKEIIERTKVGYIMNLHDAPFVKSFKFYDAELWFFDEITNILGAYESKEKDRLWSFIRTASRFNKNFQIIIFGNPDDKHCYIFDIFKKGHKMEKEFTVFRYSRDPKIIWLLWMYTPNEIFKKDLQGTMIDIMADAEEDVAKISIENTGLKNEKDYYLMNILYAKVSYHIIINDKKFTIYQKGKYRIIGDYNANSKKISYSVNSSTQWFYHCFSDWKSRGILKWENNTVREQLQTLMMKRTI